MKKIKFSLLLLPLFISTYLSAQINTYSGQILQAASTDCPEGIETPPTSSLEFELEVVGLVNQLRADYELPPLKMSPQLTAAARYHANNMCENHYFSHISLNENGEETCSPFDRIGAFYPWMAAAENIAAGQPTPESVFNAWVDSPGHFANLISEQIFEIGMGYCSCPEDTYSNRWVQNFGRRHGNYPIIINNDAETTASEDVDLYIYGEDTFSEMRLKNEGGEWTDWTSFACETNFTLESSSDVARIHAEMRNASGSTTATSSDDIIFEGGAATPGILVKVKVLLQAPYSPATSSMSTALKENDILPSNQPFNRAPWFYEGNESVGNTSNFPDNVVDWVLIEVRNDQGQNGLIEQKAGLLLEDGTVIESIGSNSGVTFFSITATNNYYVSVKTRNHLAVISNDAIELPNESPVDFSSPTTVQGGLDQLITMSDGAYTIVAGDFDSNGTITVADFNIFSDEAASIGLYLDSDCNLDKAVTVIDFNSYQNNISRIGSPAIRY